jgi:hypothetical protein
MDSHRRSRPTSESGPSERARRTIQHATEDRTDSGPLYIWQRATPLPTHAHLNTTRSLTSSHSTQRTEQPTCASGAAHNGVSQGPRQDSARRERAALSCLPWQRLAQPARPSSCRAPQTTPCPARPARAAGAFHKPLPARPFPQQSDDSFVRQEQQDLLAACPARRAPRRRPVRHSPAAAAEAAEQPRQPTHSSSSSSSSSSSRISSRSSLRTCTLRWNSLRSLRSCTLRRNSLRTCSLRWNSSRAALPAGPAGQHQGRVQQRLKLVSPCLKRQTVVVKVRSC